MASAKCTVCGKTAYAAEQVRPTDDIVFHKQCFKCEQCHTVLKLGNYAALDGKYFCKPHYKQLFALKGNYNEGFGTEKHSANWSRKDEDKKPEEESSVRSSSDKKEVDDKKDKKEVTSSYDKKSSSTTSTPLKSSDKEDTKKTSTSSTTSTSLSKSTSSDSAKSSKYGKYDSEKENNSKTTNVEDNAELKKRLEKIETLESKVEKMLDQVALRKKKNSTIRKRFGKTL